MSRGDLEMAREFLAMPPPASHRAFSRDVIALLQQETTVVPS